MRVLKLLQEKRDAGSARDGFSNFPVLALLARW
jgi:hypothetical protein